MAAQEKNMRSNALSNFTRALNSLNSLLDVSSPSNVVTPQYDKVQTCWEKLESAHDKFIEITDIEVESDKDGFGYLDAPTVKLDEVMLKYSTFCSTAKEAEIVDARQAEEEKKGAEEERRKKIEEERKAIEIAKDEEERNQKFVCQKTEFFSAVDSFHRLNATLKDILVDASDEDRRLELQKFGSEVSSLKDKKISLCGSAFNNDMAEISQKFTEAEDEFATSQKWWLSELKKSTSGGVSTDTSKASSGIATKKESVPLPDFEGESKSSPFLKFPVWKKQWDSLILEYEEKYRPTLLLKHVDDMAKSKFVGWESNYEESIKRLERFFGDPLKVVQCVMEEVKSPEQIRDGDYQGLVSYSVVLENNFNRLRSMDLEHEMSNSSAMSDIVRTFPRTIGEKWNEYLSGQEASIKLKPFTEFIVWLGSQREIWERMAAIDITKSKCSETFFGEHINHSENKRTCHFCGKEGHIKRNCPNNQGGPKPQKPRKLPAVKNFGVPFIKRIQNVLVLQITVRS